MKLNQYEIRCAVSSPVKICVAADLHGKNSGNAIELLRGVKPDLILSPGDMFENAAKWDVEEDFHRRSFHFLKEAVKIAPVYLSLGNHERGMSEENGKKLRRAGITLLDNRFVTLKDGIHLGGLTSHYIGGHDTPDLDFLAEFAALPSLKLLLCHHPEYYPKYIRQTPIDVVISGHAHGGQWRFFDRGVYAPGQGFFPHYTSGVYDNRLCVSRGMANTVPVPRFFNPRELILLHLIPCKTGAYTV